MPRHVGLRSALCWALLRLLALTLCATAANAEPGNSALPAPSAIDAYIPKAMAAVGAKGLAVAVIDGGQLTYVRSFGQRNLQAQPLQTDTVMSAASLTKPVFAYVVMQLVDEGKIDLDASIASYLPQALPGYPNMPPYAPWHDLEGDDRWKKITPRMLLSHRSGFANFVGLEPDHKLHIHFEPGSRYAYSGAGINLLQFVLDRGLGLNVDEQIRQRVFERFGMQHTSMTWQPNRADNQADGFTDSGQLHAHTQYKVAAAAWSMDTTIEDYARFAAGFVKGEGLGAASRSSITTAQWPITTQSQFPTLQAELSVAQRVSDLAAGLGVIVFKGPQGPGFYKGGHGDATGNMWVCVAQRGRCVVLLSNDVRAEKAFAGIVEQILGGVGMPWNWEYPP